MKVRIIIFLFVWNKVIDGSNDDLFVVFTFIFSRYIIFSQPDDSSSVMFLTTADASCQEQVHLHVDCGYVCHAQKKEWKRLIEERKQSGSKNTPRPIFPKEVNACKCCLMCLCLLSFPFQKSMGKWQDHVTKTQYAQFAQFAAHR